MKKIQSFYEYDVVMPIGPDDVDIAVLSIKYIFKNFSFGKMFIICSERVYDQLQLPKTESRIIFTDEEKLIPGITLQSVRKYCSDLFSDASRAGWYFQQFLKMAISGHPQMAEYYLVWDADTIPLKPVSFFDHEGKMLFSYKKDLHQPYFDTLQKILGIGRQVEYSFITEHMMIKRPVMQEIISKITESFPAHNNWAESILFNVDKIRYQSAFSEYETYGNYTAKYYPESFVFRKIKHKRSGSRITSHPTDLLLRILSFFRDTVSFEKGHQY